MKTFGHNRTLALAAGLATALVLIAPSTFADGNRSDSDRPCPVMRDGMSHGMGYFGRGRDRAAAMRFQAIDQNNDGIISDDEAAANAEAVFAVMDGDASGEITEAEFMSVHMGSSQGRNEARQAVRQKRKKTRFPQMDTDDNKMISQAEFLLAAQGRFSTTDLNGDGTVTPWEFRAHRRFF